MEEYPIPTHLKSIIKVNEALSDETNIDGKIICHCGCEVFKIMQNEGREYDELLPYSEQDGLKIIANCKDCGRNLLLFDEATQGFNGFVCHDYKTANDESLTVLRCKKCGAVDFSIVIGIEVEDKEQFIEECVNEAPDEFSPDDFADAFNWITVTVHCAACGNTDEWISLELS